MENKFSKRFRSHRSDLLFLLDHFECLPNTLKMSIKLDLDFIIETISSDYNKLLYYNKNCELNFPKFLNEKNKLKIKAIDNVDSLDLMRTYSTYYADIETLSNTRFASDDKILLPCIRKILTTTAYTTEQLSDLFNYADMTITSISDKIKDNSSFYYNTLCSFLLFEILPFKSRGVSIYYEFMSDVQYSDDNDNKLFFTFHCTVLNMIRFIIEKRIEIESDKMIDILASLVYILYEKLKIDSDPNLIFFIFKNRYGNGVSEAIKTKYNDIVNRNIDFIDILKNFKSVNSNDFDKFINYIVRRKDTILQNKTNKYVSDLNSIIIYGTIVIDDISRDLILKAFNNYTKNYIKKYINKDININFDISSDNIIYIKHELKLPNAMLKTDDGYNRYFVEYNNELFMIFQLEGFIDVVGISLKDYDDNKHFVIIQRDRNLGFRLYTDFEEIEAKLHMSNSEV